MFDPKLHPGAVISNEHLMGIFLCGPQGGMRRSHRTNTLVLTSGHIDVIYEDRWVGDVLHYTGMGLVGDQQLDGAQNRTLKESMSSGVDVHLFEVHKQGEYTYVGRAQLIDEPYQERQLDKNGAMRSVWIFPLRVDSAVPPIPQEVFRQEERERQRRARGLDDEELGRRAAVAPAKPGQRNVTTRQHERNPYVAEYARRQANGHCELCEMPAPFSDTSGTPFLETHHVVWLARGGEDSIKNTVAVCPNCHRKLHILDAEEDRTRLLSLSR